MWAVMDSRASDDKPLTGSGSQCTGDDELLASNILLIGTGAVRATGPDLRIQHGADEFTSDGGGHHVTPETLLAWHRKTDRPEIRDLSCSRTRRSPGNCREKR